MIETLCGVCFVIDHFLGVELVDEIRWETWVAGSVSCMVGQRERLIDADGLGDGVGHREEIAD